MRQRRGWRSPPGSGHVSHSSASHSHCPAAAWKIPDAGLPAAATGGTIGEEHRCRSDQQTGHDEMDAIGFSIVRSRQFYRPCAPSRRSQTFLRAESEGIFSSKTTFGTEPSSHLRATKRWWHQELRLNMSLGHHRSMHRGTKTRPWWPRSEGANEEV